MSATPQEYGIAVRLCTSRRGVTGRELLDAMSSPALFDEMLSAESRATLEALRRILKLTPAFPVCAEHRQQLGTLVCLAADRYQTTQFFKNTLGCGGQVLWPDR